MFLSWPSWASSVQYRPELPSYRGYEATNIFRGEEKNVLFRCMLFGSVLKVQISLPSSASIVRIIGVGMGKK